MGDMISTIGRQYGSGGRECQTAPGLLNLGAVLHIMRVFWSVVDINNLFFLPIFKIN